MYLQATDYMQCLFTHTAIHKSINWQQLYNGFMVDMIPVQLITAKMHVIKTSGEGMDDLVIICVGEHMCVCACAYACIYMGGM